MQHNKVKFYFFLITVFVCYPLLEVSAQDLAAAIQDETRFRQTGMIILGSWAVTNIAGGMALRANTTGSGRYFHEMNALWNTVNLGIAVAGYIGAAGLDENMSAMDFSSEYHRLDKILLFNAGLDLAYIGLGAWMTERSKNVSKAQDRWLGYGQSIMMQGGFLFLFDVMMVVLHSKMDLPEGLIMGMTIGDIPMMAMSWRF